MPDPDFAEKLRSLSFARPSARRAKRTVDDHGKAGTVEVTEHWNDRVDVTVRPNTLRYRVQGAADA